MIRARSVIALFLLLASVLGVSAQQTEQAIRLDEGQWIAYSCAGDQAIVAPSSATDGRIGCIAAPATPTPTSSPTAEPTATLTPSPTDVPPTPLPTATGAPTATAPPTSTPTSTPTPAPELSKPSANLAWFYRPSADSATHVQDIATRSKIIILQKEDGPQRDAFRKAGYKGPIVQYLLLHEVQNPSGVRWAPWGNNWCWYSGCWAALTDDMFIRKADGSRLFSGNPLSGMYYLDLSSQKTKDFILKQIVASKAHGYDGVFLDNVRLRWNLLEKRAGGTFYTGARQPYTEAAFLAAEVEMVRLIDQALGDRALWANMIDDPNTGSSWDAFLPYLDGGMHESFATGWPLHGHPLTVTQQNGALRQAEKVLSQGKSFLAVGQGNRTDTTAQEFFTASWLLIADGSDRATLRYTQADPPYGQWWLYDNYNMACGRPLGARYPVASGFARTWSECLVTVNTTTRTGSIVRVTP